MDPTCRFGLHSARVDVVSVVRREFLLLGKLGVFARHDVNFLSMIEWRKAQSIYTRGGAVSNGSDPNSNLPSSAAVWAGQIFALQDKRSAHSFTMVSMINSLRMNRPAKAWVGSSVKSRVVLHWAFSKVQSRNNRICCRGSQNAMN